MSYQQTLIELKKDVDKVLEEHPEWANFPVIYSSDEEGNSHHKVHNTICAAEVEDIKDYHLEIIAFEGEDGINANCICIN